MWSYNERHHGKGPMDGVAGTVKNVIFSEVKSGKGRYTPFEFMKLQLVSFQRLPPCIFQRASY